MASTDLPRDDTSSSLSTGTSKRGKKTKSRVSFQGDTSEKKPKTRLEIMKEELEKMRRRDEEEERRRREYRENEVMKEIARINKEKADLGLELLPNARECKTTIKKKLNVELVPARQEERMNVAAETARMKNEISLKYGFHLKKKPPDYQKLVEEFADPQKSTKVFGLPDRITRELTMEEIMDLKKIFDMFDVAGAGFVRKRDVKKIAGILGFSGIHGEPKKALDDVSNKHGGKVPFVNFLEIMIKLQTGNDPFEEVQQCFRILDEEDKGYLTFEDIRKVADEVDCTLSNRMIREMIDEADASGDGSVSLDEFLIIMLRSNAFN